MFKIRRYYPGFLLITSLVIASSFASSFLRADVLLNGVAPHSELGKEMFIAGLYTTTPSSERNAILLAQEEKQMQVRVTTARLSSRRFKRMWIEGMAVNASPDELKEHSSNMAAFSNMLKVKLVAGDIFSIDRYETRVGDIIESNVRVVVNGTTMGEISDPRFFDLLLRTWLGPVPLSSTFRDSLTRSGDVSKKLLKRFRATIPSDERIAAVKEAIQSLGPSKQIAVAVAPTAAATKPDFAPPPTVAKTEATAPKTKIAIAPPTNLAPKPKVPPAKSAPKPTKIASPAPKAKPTKAKTGKPVPALAKNSILADEEDEEILTAETILSQQLYVSKLKRYSNNFLRYPGSAAAKGQEGNVRMNVIINRQGKVLNIETLEKSRYASLNREAKRAIKQASPFPPVPKEVKGETFTFTLPILFKLQSR